MFCRNWRTPVIKKNRRTLWRTRVCCVTMRICFIQYRLGSIPISKRVFFINVRYIERTTRMLCWREKVCYEEIVFEFEFRVSTQASSRKKWGKSLRAVSIANLGAEILNQDLQNMSKLLSWSEDLLKITFKRTVIFHIKSVVNLSVVQESSLWLQKAKKCSRTLC